MPVDVLPISEILVGIPGLSSAVLTTSEKSAILARLTALEAIVNPSTGAITTGSGGLTVGGTVSLTGSVIGIGDASSDTITFIGHEEGGGSAPSIAANAAAGTGASATIMWGNDTRGLIRVITGTATTTGNLFTVTHLVARPTNTYVVQLTPADDSSASQATRVYVNYAAVTTTFWTAKASAALTQSATFYYFYWTRG